MRLKLISVTIFGLLSREEFRCLHARQISNTAGLDEERADDEWTPLAAPFLKLYAKSVLADAGLIAPPSHLYLHARYSDWARRRRRKIGSIMKCCQYLHVPP